MRGNASAFCAAVIRFVLCAAVVGAPCACDKKTQDAPKNERDTTIAPEKQSVTHVPTEKEQNKRVQEATGIAPDPNAAANEVAKKLVDEAPKDEGKTIKEPPPPTLPPIKLKKN